MSMNESNKTPTTIVIFGASGDLAQRKLVPALFHLYRKGRLAQGTRVVGFARRPYSDEDFRSRLRTGVQEFGRGQFESNAWQSFATRLRYFQGELGTGDDYRRLEGFLREFEADGTHRLYYLATSPTFYGPAVAHLGQADMVRQGEARRDIIIEKPFGSDLASAQALNRSVHAVFNESQVYRIDHYLGKETAQNILFFRFGNTIFEPVWNRRYVNDVQINVTESVDVGDRGGYYDQAGVLRDMFQNHLLQLLTLVAMEPPASFDADALRNEKVKVLSAIRAIDLGDTLRGQYEGYGQTPGVAVDSQTATYGSLKLFVDNWRWQGVPFYLRSGKALANKSSEIVIRFQCPPHLMFDLPRDYELTPNVLSIFIQPDEGIHLKFETKVPDSPQETRSVDMEFHYRSSFPDAAVPEAYERLLLDALKGDASLFARSDEIDLSWRLIDPLIQAWRSPEAPPLAIYEPGSSGPVWPGAPESPDRPAHQEG